MLLEILLADLKKQYEFGGQPDRQPTRLGLLRNFFQPRFLPVVLYRLAYCLYIHKVPMLPRILSLLNFIVFGLEIALRCEIGKGLYFPHTIGTVIGALRIGENAVIYHGVTLGAKEIDVAYSQESRPIVGNNVLIGSGAKVLGGIIIGDNVVIGANAVVTKSLPANVKVAGIPAKIIGTVTKKGDYCD